MPNFAEKPAIIADLKNRKLPNDLIYDMCEISRLIGERVNWSLRRVALMVSDLPLSA